MTVFRTLLVASILAGASVPAWAQLDEVIVTATRSESSVPGVFLEKRGDFLLLEISIENDSREISTRLKEIDDTVKGIISAADRDPSIELSIIGENSFVRPLSQENYRSGIQGGSRPDTSIAYLKVKTAIPDQVADSYKLATKLSDFVDSLDEVGRTEIDTEDEISVSVVNPYAYRGELMALITSEINAISGQLGPDYRAIISGLDKEMDWVRSGDLNLAFYVPYSYDILPTSIDTYVKDVDWDD